MRYLQFILFILLSNSTEGQTNLKEFCGNVFCIHLPSDFKVTEPYSENNSDHEVYDVSKKGAKFMTITASIESRFSLDDSINTIQDWYQDILKKRPEISYKMQKDNWFIVSGIDPKSGNVFYWKKIWKGEFISDLYIDYPKSKKDEIEPYLSSIAKSFVIHWE
jgi:hypothetical protein